MPPLVKGDDVRSGKVAKACRGQDGGQWVNEHTVN